MEKTKQIELKFGNPEQGWLPIKFKYSEFELNFDASDVPKTPTDLLCECLISTLKGIESKMYWFLEPGYYLFELIPNGEAINLLISVSNDSIVKRDETYKISGSFKSIILPMYRSLKKFDTFEFNQTDWGKISKTNLDKLTKLIRERKTAYKNE